MCRTSCGGPPSHGGRGLVPRVGQAGREPRARHGHHHSRNVKHWHGAKADSWFSHVAVEVPGSDASNEWLEPVSDEEYAAL